MTRRGLFNYAMTLANSPYGKVYFESIKRKLDTSSKNGIFILEVNPWSICSETLDPNDESNFREADLFLSKLNCVDCNPNIEYLARHYSDAYINLWRDTYSPLILHPNGWLEVNVSIDYAAVLVNTQTKMNQYRNDVLPKYHFSDVRYEYLKKLGKII